MPLPSVGDDVLGRQFQAAVVDGLEGRLAQGLVGLVLAVLVETHQVPVAVQVVPMDRHKPPANTDSRAHNSRSAGLHSS